MSQLSLTIDMSDLFFEEKSDEGYVEFNFNEALRQAVINEVKVQVRQIASTEIKNIISEFIESDLKIEIRATMKSFLHNFLATKKLSGRYNDQTAEQIIEEQFNSEIGRSDSIGKEVGKLAEKWGSTLKAQYDAAFATRIVHKLNEEGLLLPSAAQLLLSK